MQITSVIAIYFITWWFSLFLVLPFRLGKKGQQEAFVPGQAEGAPPSFSVWRTIGWTTVVAAAWFGLFYANYVNQWITVEMLDYVH